MPYQLDLKKIKPKNIKKSDKYSKQIYNFLKKHPNRTNIYYIQTQDVYDFDTGEYTQLEVTFDIDNFRLDKIWIGSISRQEYSKTKEHEEGYIDWMYGNSLGTIISNSKEKYTDFANPWNNKKNVIDITEQFWEKYIETGRCLYGKHSRDLADNESQYTYLNDDTRICNYCGQKLKKERVTHIYVTDKWCEVNQEV